MIRSLLGAFQYSVMISDTCIQIDRCPSVRLVQLAARREDGGTLQVIVIAGGGEAVQRLGDTTSSERSQNERD